LHGPGAALHDGVQSDQQALTELRTGESFVLVFVFYEVLCLQISYFDILKWLMVLYEYCRGQNRHRHVGISIGKRHKHCITMLPYDLSCWNGRQLGATVIAQRDDNSPKKNIVRASDAMYVDVDSDTVRELLRNFDRRAGAYTWNRLPMAGARYPDTGCIVNDLLHYWGVRQWKSWTKVDIDMEMEQLQTCMQCAQFALLAVMYLIKGSLLSIDNYQKHQMLSLLFYRTALHPHSLWQMMCKCPGFHQATDTDKFCLLSHTIDNAPLQRNVYKNLKHFVLPDVFVSVMFNPMLIDDLYRRPHVCT